MKRTTYAGLVDEQLIGQEVVLKDGSKNVVTLVD